MNYILKFFIPLFLLFFAGNVFAEETLQEQIEARISTDMGFEDTIIILPKNSHNINTYEFIQIDYSGQGERAELTLKNKEGVNETIKIRFEPATHVLALNKNKNKNELIDEEDIQTLKIPKSKHGRFFTSGEEIKGLSARKNLHSHQPLSKFDLIKPSVVEKGNTVKMMFTKGHLNIEAPGIAIEHGGIGDIIRVKNLESNKVVSGKILDSERVLVNY